MKTAIKTICDDSRYNQFKKGQQGYVDGYIRGADDIPYACVVIEGKIIFMDFYSFEVTGLMNGETK